MSNDKDFHYSSHLDDLAFAVLAMVGASLLALKANDISGAGSYFPLTICIVMLCAGLATFLRALVLMLRRDVGGTVTLNRDGLLYGALASLALIIACVMTPWVGYFPAITFLLLSVPLALRFRRPVALIGTTLLFEALVYFIFIEAFSRRLPSGSLFQ